MNKMLVKVNLALALLLLNFSPSVHAQSGDAQASASEAALYQGADRTQRLVAAAKREGALTIYTSVNKLQHDSPIIQAFQQKYGIKVNIWRAGSEVLLQRAITEARAKRYEADVFTFTGSGLESLRREKILQKVRSPLFNDLVPAALPPHREWVGTYLQVFVQAYNTNLIKKNELPHSYADLLDPKWKNRLAIESEDYEWFYSVVKEMGEEKGLQFFRDLVAKSNVSIRTGHSLLTNLVGSGEVPLALTVYQYTPEQLKQKGAPIDWFVIEPAIVGVVGTGVAQKAPHPNAAILFYDYLLGEEAQKLWVDMSFTPVNKKVPSPLKGTDFRLIDPTVSVDEAGKWNALYKEIVLQKRSR